LAIKAEQKLYGSLAQIVARKDGCNLLRTSQKTIDADHAMPRRDGVQKLLVGKGDEFYMAWVIFC